MIKSIGFALDTTNVPSFLLDWEVTKLCNLDCSYCVTGLDGGHDNSTKHSPLEECLQTIDFMYQYVDLYMQYKKPSQRKVILNVYGEKVYFILISWKFYGLVEKNTQHIKISGT